MIFKDNVGIVSYGAYLPTNVISSDEVFPSDQSLLIQKTVGGCDEDTITIAVDAGYQALQRLDKRAGSANNISNIDSLFIGSESHPYAVKPSGTVVAQALGLSENISTADLQFACKAGTQALQICLNQSIVSSKLSMAIGADTAQSKPGDALELTAAAGGAAFIVGRGKKNSLLARVIATTSVATDTPDFWRRPGSSYPSHGGRFTGEPAYFYHIKKATKQLLTEVNLKPKDIDFCIFHTPNAKFPRLVAKSLGFSNKQIEPSLFVEKIGNTYAGASLLALAAVLDKAKPGQKILMTSYGSGAGADSFLFETTKNLELQRRKWSGFIKDYLKYFENVDYRTYRKMMVLKEH